MVEKLIVVLRDLSALAGGKSGPVPFLLETGAEGDFIEPEAVINAFLEDVKMLKKLPKDIDMYIGYWGDNQFTIDIPAELMKFCVENGVSNIKVDIND